MDVMLADGSQVSASHTCLVPLAVCAKRGRAFHCVVKCHVLPEVNHNMVLGINWLQATNPEIDLLTCTVSV